MLKRTKLTNAEPINQRLWARLLPLAAAIFVVPMVVSCAAHTAAGEDPRATVAPPTAAGAAPAAPEKMPPCPLMLQGTTVTTLDTKDGITVDFINASAVEEVRRRIRGRAAFNKAHPRPMPVKMTKEIKDTAAGVRMIIRALDAADVGKVRAMMRRKLEKLKAEANATR